MLEKCPEAIDRCWSLKRKQFILDQKPLIANWTITHDSYENVPIRDDWHYHVDPPYQVKGKSYRCNKIDFEHLGNWCRQLKCADVCEGVDADWLPFVELMKIKNMRSNEAPELVWSPDKDYGLKDRVIAEYFD